MDASYIPDRDKVINWPKLLELKATNAVRTVFQVISLCQGEELPVKELPRTSS